MALLLWHVMECNSNNMICWRMFTWGWQIKGPTTVLEKNGTVTGRAHAEFRGPLHILSGIGFRVYPKPLASSESRFVGKTLLRWIYPQQCNSSLRVLGKALVWVGCSRIGLKERGRGYGCSG